MPATGHDRSFHHLPQNLHKAAIRTHAAAPGKWLALAMVLDDKNFLGPELSG